MLAGLVGAWFGCGCGLFSSTPAVEEPPCPSRGTLDEAYCDADGDLLADVPANRVEPDTLIFSYTPVEDPAVYQKVWDGFVAHLAEVTGRKVTFFPVQSYAAQYEAMRAGRLHIAGVNTGGTPVAVNCSGFVPFAMMAAADDSYGYEMEIITHPDSGIATVADLKGRTLAFSSPTSNSGYKAPSAILLTEFGLKRGTDYTPAFSGKHDASILGVVNRDYDAAAIANSVLERMIARGAVSEDDVHRVYTSQTFPTTAYGHAHNLHPQLVGDIKKAFFTFPWEGSALAREFDKEDKFVPISYDEDWAIVRTIDAANDVTYACR
ncbi:MAG: phosphate/phosphite/phosphonate ABC transporter substrate-binding protein [Myxococcales bacterium]|nr:phosphate/phosphite/phosphonate ABC transporter substrate-binding protein [Myxococcales bacterium]